jgi:hypothetical protein
VAIVKVNRPRRFLPIFAGQQSFRTCLAFYAGEISCTGEKLKSCDQVMMNDCPTALLKPAANEILQRWPASKRVNSSRARDDDPTLMEPISAV